MLSLLVAAISVPPPPPGDDRSAILATVTEVLDALMVGDAETARAHFAPEAIFPIVDARGAETRVVTLDLDAVLGFEREGLHQEPLGIPTVFQDGALAQVWVPYSFWVDGVKQHCGIDNATLVEQDGEWKITQMAFTMNSLDTCDALGAPTVANPDKVTP
ncbi:nuclear transport factor 2 family protein [Sphingomicrobium aestuariivivum]|uniref:nuclear transport factor 2 family protein n=1 Tax=Sphingomicrobium aestuariivivum TaxID=1582356 RepID=UPI001FD6B3F3|nr:nuclear transport factor 2 family protein [Sphingomicrobium aestuariivivum]MCJ8190357.1 nuclear transport factor 2 family protein [Sphingomicrobium aestuariivivum]